MSKKTNRGRSWAGAVIAAVVIVGGPVPVAGEAHAAAPAALAGASAPTSYAFNATPIARTATLKPATSYPIVLTVFGGAIPVPNATLYLSFVSAPGGGSATTGQGPLGVAPMPVSTDATGHVAIAFRTPAALPAGGTDVFVAEDKPSAPAVRAETQYSYGSDWAKFHGDAMNLGVTGDGAITAATATALHVAWRASLGAAGYASPAVAYDARLGRTLVYVGTQAVAGKGALFGAFDAQTGAPVWHVRIRGGNILSSAAVFAGVVYVGTETALFAFDATSGTAVCSFATPGRVTASPVVAAPDGGGALVYFGDTGLTGGPDPGHFWAINANSCKPRWEFSRFGQPPGSVVGASYDEPGFAHDATGRPLVVFGSTDPDNAVYALDGRTGALVWRFQTAFVPDGDVGAGPTISAPGVNGFASGVVYITGKDERTYALSLTTGRQIWMFDILKDSGNPKETESVAALVGGRLFLGYGAGIYCLDAVSGKKVWRDDGMPLVYSSPAVSGVPGDQVVLVGDTGGHLRTIGLGGRQLWALSTGGSLFSSPAIVGTRAFIADAVTDQLIALAVPSP